MELDVKLNINKLLESPKNETFKKSGSFLLIK